MVKKRLIQKLTYKKGTEIRDLNEFRKLIKKTTTAYLKDQTVWNDDTESITVEIHFNRK
jgi:hypothetical protein